jgi:hypothetical protein
MIPTTVIISAIFDNIGYPKTSGSIPRLKILKENRIVIGIVKVNEKILADNAITIKLPKGVEKPVVNEWSIQTINETQIGVNKDAIMFEIIVLFRSFVLSENFGLIIPKFKPVPNREEKIPDKLPLILAITGNNINIPAILVIIGVMRAQSEPVIKLPITTILRASDASFNSLISGLWLSLDTKIPPNYYYLF